MEEPNLQRQLEETLIQLNLFSQDFTNTLLNSINRLILAKSKEGEMTDPDQNLTKNANAGLFLKEMLGPFVQSVIVEVANGCYAIDPEDQGVGLEMRRNGGYGADEFAYISEFLKSESNVLVVGAHIGALAIPISRKCRSTVAVEANPDTFRLLQTSIQLNNASSCTAYQFAASDQPGEIRFLLNRANSGGSKRVPIVKDHKYFYDSPEEISVRSYRLDDYFEQRNFDIIVMDLEGSEIFALRGMSRLLEACEVLLVEFLPHHLKNVSGVSVEQFLAPLMAFEYLTVPSKQIKVAKKDFHSLLEYMFVNNVSEDVLIFEK